LSAKRGWREKKGPRKNSETFGGNQKTIKGRMPKKGSNASYKRPPGRDLSNSKKAKRGPKGDHVKGLTCGSTKQKREEKNPLLFGKTVQRTTLTGLGRNLWSVFADALKGLGTARKKEKSRRRAGQSYW